MSRCFPYPPPGYVKNGMRGEALIESIKLLRENEKAITERRKEKKRDKKEKKKERKEKEKEKEKTHEISDGKLKKVDNLFGTYLPKEREDETEQLEKSGLTEEHEQPISQNLCYLSDSTQSNKREWHTSLSNRSQNHGNTLRIRFSFKKHRESDALPSTEHLCSTSGEDYLAQHEDDARRQFQDTNTTTNTVVPQITAGADERLHSHSLNKDSFGQCSNLTAVLPSKHKMHGVESVYKALVEDWLSPPLWVEQNDVGDQDWLFRTKQQEKGGSKRTKTDSDISCYEGSTLQPLAHFLPSCEIHALPYTIPF